MSGVLAAKQQLTGCEWSCLSTCHVHFHSLKFVDLLMLPCSRYLGDDRDMGGGTKINLNISKDPLVQLYADRAQARMCPEATLHSL